PATGSSGLASPASVSRLLYFMGRNGVLPRKAFGYFHPKFRTPAFNVIFVGAVSLLAIGPSLELISAVINFGALIAFTFVNLSVIAYFAFQQKRYKRPVDIFSYIIMPSIGAGFTGVLWYFLHADAFAGWIVWVSISSIYMLFPNKLGRTTMAVLDFDEPDTPIGKEA